MRSSINGNRSSILLLEEAGEIVDLVEISIHDAESSPVVVGRRYRLPPEHRRH